MRILVTGGAGYIGSIMVPALLKEGHKVIVVDNFMYRQSSLLDCCNQSNFTVIRGDCRDKALIKQQLKKADAIIPLACLVGAPLCQRDPINARNTNFGAVKMLLGMRSRNQRVLFPSTNSGYGIGQKDICCTEKSPLKPVSLYGRLKVEIEKIILDEGNVVSLRLATVFGISPRMRLDLLVNNFTYRAVYDGYLVVFEGHFKRNYIHVRDVARAFIHCLNNFNKMKNQPYNAGISNANISKLELCGEIKKQVPGLQIFISNTGRDPDKRNYIVSNEKIERTGFRTSISLEDGIRELINGYQIIQANQFSNV